MPNWNQHGRRPAIASGLLGRAVLDELMVFARLYVGDFDHEWHHQL
ncbi:hypothetical protein [Pseudomonas sp. B21-019]|nr:hypothetical protein [Pseudomonas sp. B21-019]UVM35010.1 hypothetical protein LOY36_09985 [Pseudomonas sp. B21-019]